MKALLFGSNELRLVEDRPAPTLRDGWAVLRVRVAGICRTDLEIARGYMGFEGVLGHEFVATVEQCGDEAWLGKRVVGEINAACGTCDACARGLGRHCPSRTVLGIAGLDGCLAEYCTLPVANLRKVPDDLDDERAVFTEPLSAAYEILDQVAVSGAERCVVLGDGKLGILCAWVLATRCAEVTLVGRHTDKLTLAEWGGIRTRVARAPDEGGDPVARDADLVVEATGTAEGLTRAIALCRPRGTIVLKSTVATPQPVDLAPLVIDEIKVVGSRCGRFHAGLAGAVQHRFPVERLITARYPLEQGREAFARAAEPGALKVLLRP
jgi:alcohol dehydrogenase